MDDRPKINKYHSNPVDGDNGDSGNRGNGRRGKGRRRKQKQNIPVDTQNPASIGKVIPGRRNRGQKVSSQKVSSQKERPLKTTNNNTFFYLLLGAVGLGGFLYYRNRN